ncbi:MAG TPA: hypothetical protein VF193_18075 [Steroidobacter sp.]
MMKQLALAVTIVLMLGTSVSAPLREEDPAAKSTPTAETASANLGSSESARIVSMWEAHASSAASIRLARPL